MMKGWNNAISDLSTFVGEDSKNDTDNSSSSLNSKSNLDEKNNPVMTKQENSLVEFPLTFTDEELVESHGNNSSSNLIIEPKQKKELLAHPIG